MTNIMRSEAIKIASVRVTYVSAAALAAIGFLAADIFTSPLSEGRWLAMQDHPFMLLYLTVLGLFAYSFGARSVTDEFRYRTITSTGLATPKRERIIASKAAVAGMTGGLAGAIGVGVTLAVVGPWVARHSLVDMTAADALQMTGALVLVAALFSVIGVGVGAIVRHPVASMVGGIGWFAMVEPGIAGFMEEAGSFLPGRAAGAILGVPGPYVLSAWEGAAVFAAYALLAVAGGILVTAKRDLA